MRLLGCNKRKNYYIRTFIRLQLNILEIIVIYFISVLLYYILLFFLSQELDYEKWASTTYSEHIQLIEYLPYKTINFIIDITI